jgi:uncharacterized protein (TIRG00374 family)
MKIRTTRRRALLFGLVVGLPLSAFFFWLAFRNADLGEVRSVLADANVRFVLLAVAAISVMYVGQAVRWRAIARTPEVPTVRFAEMVVSGVAVNNVVPGRVGDLLRARWLQVAAGIPAGRSLATVFVDRAFDVFALVAFLAISLSFVSSAEWLLRIAAGGFVLLTGVGLILVAARIYARRRTRERRGHRRLVRRIARDMLEGLADPLGGIRALALGSISLAAWAVWGLAAWSVAHAIGIALSPVEAIFITAVINLGVAIPSSPGFIGTYQWLGVSVLALFDVRVDQALAFAILMQAVWYVPSTIVGGALLIRRGLRTIDDRSAPGVPHAEQDAQRGRS